MYLHLSSNDSKDTHPNNENWDFTIDLKKDVWCIGEWECSLVDCNYISKKDELYLFCDICSDSFIHNNYLPLLRIISGEIRNLFYLPITREHISRIRVYIRNEKGEVPSFSSENFRCTLHVRKITK